MKILNTMTSLVPLAIGPKCHPHSRQWRYIQEDFHFTGRWGALLEAL